MKTTDFPLMRDKPNVLRSWQLFLQPNTECMWLTRDEWRAMVPSDPVKGSKRNVHAAIAERMARLDAGAAHDFERAAGGEHDRCALIVQDHDAV